MDYPHTYMFLGFFMYIAHSYITCYHVQIKGPCVIQPENPTKLLQGVQDPELALSDHAGPAHLSNFQTGFPHGSCCHDAVSGKLESGRKT